MPMRGKVVLVTGGTGALGKVIVRRFGKEGARVFYTTRAPSANDSPTSRITRFPAALGADVTDEKSVDRLFKRIIGQVKRIDVLINTVGGFAVTGALARTSPSDWRRMMEINLFSAFLCSRAFLRQKGLDRYGRIINVAAQTAFRPSLGKTAYAVSKGAVATLTALLGDELRGTGITVNAIAPSIIDTPDNRKSMPGEDHSAWVAPEVIAGEMVHLCRPESGAINGAVIPIFGGI